MSNKFIPILFLVIFPAIELIKLPLIYANEQNTILDLEIANGKKIGIDIYKYTGPRVLTPF